jgi:hypothetical protein
MMTMKAKKAVELRKAGGVAAVALEIITGRGRAGATALEIGVAVVLSWRNRGKVWRRARGMRMADREALGLAAALRLVEGGQVVATEHNRFMLVRFAKKSVPPAVRVEDMPAPGFMGGGG